MAREAALEQYTLHGRVLDSKKRPLSGRRIHTIEVAPAERDLGKSVTDGRGHFAFVYSAEPGSREKKSNWSFASPSSRRWPLEQRPIRYMSKRLDRRRPNGAN